MAKALLIYPKNPVTFWSFDEALKIAKKKSAFPSLGLLTIAGMLPDNYEMRHVDLNVTPLDDEDIVWADIVLTSSMIIHWHSLGEIIALCNDLGTPVLNGGPLPTQYSKDIEGKAVFYLGEAENGFVDLVEQMIEAGPDNQRAHIDYRGKFNSLAGTPNPRWDLIDFNDYTSMVLQFTRGCPEACTFCNIPSLYGKITRLREKNQTLKEFEVLYEAGWRGPVMAVDDNFVGNSETICELLEEAIIPWQQERGYPFSLATQASIRVSDNPRLVEAMRLGGFDKIFCGIESPAKESLKFMGAQKNLQGDRSLLDKVKVLQNSGLEVMAGFIIGLDADPDDIAEQMVEFIQDAAIPISMVGILGVLPDTPDFKRFKRLDRLIENVKYTGDSGLFNRILSFIPAIPPETLFARHRKVVETINSPENYFERCLRLFEHQHHPLCTQRPLTLDLLKAALRALWTQGVIADYRAHYWKFLFKVASKHPRKLGDAIARAVSGHHLIMTTKEALQVDNLYTFLKEAPPNFKQYCNGHRDVFQPNGRPQTLELFKLVHQPFKGVRDDFEGLRHKGTILIEIAEQQCAMLREESRQQINQSLARFRKEIERILPTRSGVSPAIAGR